MSSIQTYKNKNMFTAIFLMQLFKYKPYIVNVSAVASAEIKSQKGHNQQKGW